jgi:hypothetical protein
MLLIFTGCNDKPDPVGHSALTSKDLQPVHVDTIYATQHNSTKYFQNTSEIDRIMLGINTSSNGWKYKAWSCIRFFSWPDTLLGVRIDSAYIQLKSNYVFGDSTSPLTFSVYSALQNWTGDSLSYDSIKSAGIYYNTTMTMSHSTNSDGWLTMNIRDTAVIRSWFVSNSDTNKGVIIGPTESGNINFIRGFVSFNSVDTTAWPKLIIKYTNTNDGSTGTYTNNHGSSKYVSDLDYGTTQFATDSMIYVQNGIAYHTNIWFNNFSLLRQSSIYRATLEMTLDASSSPSYQYDALYASRTTTDGAIDFDYVVYEGAPTIVSGKKIYKFDIAYIVNAWKNGTTIPKLIVYGKNQSLSFDLFKFYGSISIYKPRIIITYFSKQ